MEVLENMGYSIFRKYRRKEIIFFYNKKTNEVIRVNLYYGTYRKYNKKTKKQIPFIFDELRCLCRLTEQSFKENFSNLLFS